MSYTLGDAIAEVDRISKGKLCIVTQSLEGDSAYLRHCSFLTIALAVSQKVVLYMKTPTLVDETEYPRWIETIIAFANGERDTIHRFLCHMAKNPEGNCLYTSANQVTYETEDYVEIWTAPEITSSKVKRFLKTPNGFMGDDSEKESYLSSCITCKGDLYKNPRNESIHSLEILQEDNEAYTGTNMFYTKCFEDYLLVNLFGNWIWVLLESFAHTCPPYLRAEYDMLVSLNTSK